MELEKTNRLSQRTYTIIIRGQTYGIDFRRKVWARLV